MKKSVSEIVILRSLACLAIVLMHSITSATQKLQLNGDLLFSFDSIRIALMFGTPMFIFISEFLLAYSYSKSVPKGFLLKRFKYILIPYFVMALFYAGVEAWDDRSGIGGFIIESFGNVFLATFHGYFIIIVFQFYLLHMLVIKTNLKNLSYKTVVPVTVLVNVLYLAFFNFFDFKEYLSFIPSIDGIWGMANTLPFVAWIGYFAVAYYSGSMYKEFKDYLKRNKIALFVFALFSLSIVQILFHTQILSDMHSKRVDVMFYTLSLWFAGFYISSKVKVTPFLSKISKYSFGIYLLHPFFIRMLPKVMNVELHLFNPIIYIVCIFLLAVSLSILTTYLLNLNKYGKFIVGQTGKDYYKENSNKVKQKIETIV